MGAGVGGTGVGVGAGVVEAAVGDGVAEPPVGAEVAVVAGVEATAAVLDDGGGVAAGEHAAASTSTHTSARSGRVTGPTLRHNGCRTRLRTR